MTATDDAREGAHPCTCARDAAGTVIAEDASPFCRAEHRPPDATATVVALTRLDLSDIEGPLGRVEAALSNALPEVILGVSYAIDPHELVDKMAHALVDVRTALRNLKGAVR